MTLGGIMCAVIPYFKIEELVPEDLFNYFEHSQHILWGLLDYKALQTLVSLREKFGKITVNDWCFGGNLQYRGFRPGNCNIGADFSQHKLGNAFDCSFEDYTAEEVREYVLNHPEEFPHITSIEMGVSWFHFDCRFVPDWLGVIQQFWPRGKNNA